MELVNLQRRSDDALQEIEGLKQEVAKYLTDNDSFDQKNRSLSDLIKEVERLYAYQKAQVEEMTEEIVLLRVMKIDTEKKLQVQMTEAENLKKLNEDLEHLFKAKARDVLRQGRELVTQAATNQDLIQQRLTL